MKTTRTSLLIAFCSLFSAAAQEQFLEPFPTEIITDQAIIYESPVVYQGPVVYNAPVVYNGPVYYVLPAAEPVYAYEPYACEPYNYTTTLPELYPSTVVYIGGGGAASVTHYGFEGSQVIPFGQGQACAQGYRFGHFR